MTRERTLDRGTDGDVAARVAAAVDAVVHSGDAGTGVRELAAATGTSRSSAHRTLTALAEAGVVRQVQGGRYSPGLTLAVWSWHVSTRSPLLELGGRALAGLADQVGETAHLVGWSQAAQEAVVLDAVESHRPVHYRLPLGSSVPLHAGSAGKAVAAYLSDDTLRGLPMEALTARTTTDLDTLRAEFARVRKTGYSTTEGEHFEEATGVSAPYFIDGLVAGSLNVTIPRYRLGADGVAPYAPLVLDTAKKLTAQLAVRDAFPASSTDADRPPMSLPRSMPSSGNRAIDRVIEVVDRVARSTADTQEEIVAGHTADADDQVVRNLTATGLIRVRQDGRYRPGLTLLLWSRLLRTEATLQRMGREVLGPVVDALGETAAVVVLESVGCTARYAEPVQSRQPIQYHVTPYTSIPLHAGAAGWAILAHADNAVQACTQRMMLTDEASADLSEIEHSLEEVRRVGYAVSREERLADAGAVAAPFFADGVVVGSLTTMIPLYRMERVDLARHGSVLRAAADRLTDLLSARSSGGNSASRAWHA